MIQDDRNAEKETRMIKAVDIKAELGHAPTLVEPVVLTALEHFLGAGETTRA